MDGAVYGVQPMAGEMNELIKHYQSRSRELDVFVSDYSSLLFCIRCVPVSDGFNRFPLVACSQAASTAPCLIPKFSL
jgi:hypothetical protein